MQDLTASQARAEQHPGPGGLLPYGMDRLRKDCDLVWTDGQRRGLWAGPVGHKGGAAARRLLPGLQGAVGAAFALPRVPGVDAVLSIFENVGLGLGALGRLLPSSARVPHVLMACWLAEDLTTMSSLERSSVSWALRRVDRVLVFSSNQCAPLAEAFDYPVERIGVVPFGVDVDYYDAAKVDSPAGGRGAVAVGSDSRRDYATLFEAAHRAALPMTVACHPRNIAGLSVPPEITIVTGAFNGDYRRLLHGADVVVTPTTAPAYPSGQSVVLEAMAMGRPTVTTDSAAMREYVRPDVDGILVPPGDPDRLASAVQGLLGDHGRATALAISGAERVRAAFTFEDLWSAVAEVLVPRSG
jgi:glycosyltransferase involved in cell wall biosynthesis